MPKSRAHKEETVCKEGSSGGTKPGKVVTDSGKGSGDVGTTKQFKQSGKKADGPHYPQASTRAGISMKGVLK